MTPTPVPLLGVVIPTLNEEARLPRLLADLQGLSIPAEVVVCDGGSRDRTREVARARGARVVRASKGRSVQLNAGAAALETPWLLFLHADTRLHPSAAAALVRWIAGADSRTAAYFHFGLEGEDRFWRFIELGQALRERVFGLAYGDQGLVVSRRLFREVGGYPTQPLMEDVALLSKLREVGRVEKIPEKLYTSPRRYEREGRWKGWLRNSALLTLYLLGVPPGRLRSWYPDEPEPTARTSPKEERMRRALLVFAKNPEPGRVKTRLAADVGEVAAAKIYRQMGRQILDQVRGGDYRIVVCYDPPEAGEEVERWLGARDLSLRPQADGDLTVRLESAFEEAFKIADQVCVIGTDAPAVDRNLVEEAFGALKGADVVLGPAKDGGYYLLALSRPIPELFQEIPWSTGRVLEATVERARARDLSTVRLQNLSDVDTVADLPERFA